MVLTVIVIAFAIPTGAFSTMEFRGTSPEGKGECLYAIGNAVTDFWTDVLIFFSIFIVIVVPQAIAYAVCALNGCASKIRFVNWCANLMCWCVIKFFAVAAGYSTGRFISPLMLNGIADGRIESTSLLERMIDLFFAIVSMLVSVSLALGYRRGSRILNRLAEACPDRVKDALKKANTWATKNNKHAEDKDKI